MTTKGLGWTGLAGAILMLAAFATRPTMADDVTLTVWSHEADEPAKVAFREAAARELEKSHPGVHVKITWYEKEGLYAALKTALPAGQGPDVFYLEPDQTEYISAGYIVPLDNLVNWNNIYDWARQVWTHEARSGACRKRPIRSSCTTTRTCWRSSALRCRRTPSSRRASFSISLRKRVPPA